LLFFIYKKIKIKKKNFLQNKINKILIIDIEMELLLMLLLFLQLM